MHAAERERAILTLLEERGFVSFQDLDRQLPVSPATIRRDLDRLDQEGRLVRVRGGARPPDEPGAGRLQGTPFQVNLALFSPQKAAIGEAAAALCRPGESIIIDGGTTTLQMCRHLEPLGLQVLTNSLHIVNALLPQPNTRIAVPSGTIFREQDIILSPFDDDGTGNFRASRMFMGAAGLGPHGLMQVDSLLMQAERRLLGCADELVVLVDSSKFRQPVGHVLFPLARIATVVTDDGLGPEDRRLLEQAGVRVIIAPADSERA